MTTTTAALRAATYEVESRTPVQVATWSGAVRPRLLVAPEATSSEGPATAALAASAGLRLDPWQANALNVGLARRAGSWSSFEVALVVARQNGKGAILEALELGALFRWRAKLIMHSAHQFKTAREAFTRVADLIRSSPELSAELKPGRAGITTATGNEAINLRTGQRLRFIARSRSSGRGFSPDLIVLDEAWELAEEDVDALLPGMSARPDPQVWYTTSAPDQLKHPNCHVISKIRRRALGGEPDVALMEWSPVSEGLTVDERSALREDREAWRQANPAMGIRINPAHIGRELRSMEPRSFDVERLSIGDWPSGAEGVWTVVREAAWRARAGAAPRPEDCPVLAVGIGRAWDVDATAMAACWAQGPVPTLAELVDEWRARQAVRRAAELATLRRLQKAAGGKPDPTVLPADDAEPPGEDELPRFGRERVVSVIEAGPGTDWVVGKVSTMLDRWPVCAVVLDESSPAGVLRPKLEQAGVQVLLIPKAREVAQAFGGFVQAVQGDAPSLRHYGQELLDASVSVTLARPLGDAKVWARKGADMSASESAGLALWGFEQRAYDYAGAVDIMETIY